MNFRSLLHWHKSTCILAFALLAAHPLSAQEAGSTMDGPYAQPPAPIVRPDTSPDNAQQPPADDTPDAPLNNYDPSLFQKRIPPAQLAFLTQYAGAPAGELYKDKQFRNLMHAFVPSCTFHYGSDKSLTDALDEVIKGSSEPVRIRDNRYVLLGGHQGAYLNGKGFLWIDMQEGIGLGGFYFHPTNGEPTPSVNVFSRQVLKEALLDWSELPPAFNQDMASWTQADRVPPLTTRYFITGSDKKILLEHDEDFCFSEFRDCDQMNEDASDLDVNAAIYLEQTHYVTNATAWMITDPDQEIWIGVRNHTCGSVIDPLACHIRMTRERTHVILHAPPPRPLPHPIHR